MIDPRPHVASFGDKILEVIDLAGEFALLAGQTLRAVLRGKFPARETLVQFDSVVVRSTAIVTLTALFTGMVLALQTVVSLTRFGAKPYTGSFVGLAFVLELGPVLTALVVSGRVGAGITAEIGAMTVSEQVDAIRALGADPIQKLVVPRMLAATIGLARESVGDSAGDSVEHVPGASDDGDLPLGGGNCRRGEPSFANGPAGRGSNVGL